MKSVINEYEARAYSQDGEAGILNFLINLLGVKPHFLVEIGTGLQSNCNNLLRFHSWRGVLIDGATWVCDVLGYRLEEKNVQILNTFVTQENIDELLRESRAPRRIGILSIDIDGMDYHVWKAIEWLIPKIVVIEYNASLGPDLSVTVPYKADFNRFDIHPGYHGASLVAMTRLAATKGLALVGCESAGCNAFYVDRELLSSELPEVTPAQVYYPHRRRGGCWEDQFKLIQHQKYEEV